MSSLLIIIFYFISLFGSHAQHDKSKIYAKDLSSVCIKTDPKRNDIAGVIEIRENIGNNKFCAFIDVDGIPASICESSIMSSYIPNSFTINNEILLSNKELIVFNNKNILPESLYYFQVDNRQYIILELFNFMSNAAGWYSYLVFILNSDGKLIDYYKGKESKQQQDILNLIFQEKVNQKMEDSLLIDIEDEAYPIHRIEEYQYNTSTQIKIVDLSPTCRMIDTKRDDIDGVIKVEQTIDSISIYAFFDISLDIPPICDKQGIDENYAPNTIKINGAEFHIGADLNGIESSRFIPSRLFKVTGKTIYVVFEMYNISYTTVGGGYTYIIIQLDQSNKIKRSEIFEYIKEPIKPDVLVKQIEKLF